MRRALELARGVWGTTHPNPMVGAVVVEEGRIVGEGATAPDGGSHAERPLALLARGKTPRPERRHALCHPRTLFHRRGAPAPAPEAIIAAGIKHVVVGATDPNPAHAGRGFHGALRDAGIEVITGSPGERVHRPQPDLQPVDHRRPAPACGQGGGDPGRQDRLPDRRPRAGSRNRAAATRGRPPLAPPALSRHRGGRHDVRDEGRTCVA